MVSILLYYIIKNTQSQAEEQRIMKDILAIFGIMYLMDSCSGKKKSSGSNDPSGGCCGCLILIVLAMIFSASC